MSKNTWEPKAAGCQMGLRLGGMSGAFGLIIRHSAMLILNNVSSVFSRLVVWLNRKLES